MSGKITITIAEPSEIIRVGIVNILKRLGGLHMEVFEVADMENLKGALSFRKPDILIINPAAVGLLSLQQLRKEVSLPGMKYIALQVAVTDNSSLKFYDECISIYDPAARIRDKLTKLVSNPGTVKQEEPLTPREKEVVTCVVQGLTNKQTADKLHLSSHTITTHRKNIAAKLNIHSTAGLTIYAIVNNLVDLNEINDPQ